MIFLISSQISSAQGSISSLTQQLQEKEAELKRLEAASAELTVCEGKFIDRKSLCLEPELTASTWYGKLASNFDDYRKDSLQVSYTAIYDEQLSQSMEELKEAIEKKKQEIKDLKQRIAAAQARLDSLYDLRERELARNE